MKESEIRQKETFDRYLELVKEDSKAFFKENDFIHVRCPACGGKDEAFQFEKFGFKYVSCVRCGTLFVNPRPDSEVLKRFYSESRSASFWINEFFKPFADARKKKIFAPRAEHIAKMLNEDRVYLVGDIGAGFGIFLEELRERLPKNRYVAIEPSKGMADICRKKGLEVKCEFFEGFNAPDYKFDFLTAFELAEHLYDPLSFFNKAYALLKPGGYLYITTLNGLGFDILLLWDKSKAVMPPHHLNFFNVSSIKSLLERLKFQIVEISTPGRLDWDIVEGMIKNYSVKLDRFWSHLAEKGSQDTKDALQEWLSGNNLSSHMRVIAKRPL